MVCIVRALAGDPPLTSLELPKTQNGSLTNIGVGFTALKCRSKFAKNEVADNVALRAAQIRLSREFRAGQIRFLTRISFAGYGVGAGRLCSGRPGFQPRVKRLTLNRCREFRRRVSGRVI